MPNGDLIGNYIQEVQEQALTKNLDNLTDRQYLAIMLGWLAQQINGRSSDDFSWTDQAKAKAPLAGMGALGAGLLWLGQLVLEHFTSVH